MMKKAAFGELDTQIPIRPPRTTNLFPYLVFCLLMLINFMIFEIWPYQVVAYIGLLIGLLLSMSLKVANEWEKAVVLRLGKFRGLKGPGHFWVIPVLDSVAYWVDQRIVATPFLAEQTLTKDTVPVNVDAILFWMVWDPEKAALEVENYREAVAWIAQTALRDVVGRSMLSDILSGREQLDKVLQEVIDSRTEPWGITVQSVEIRDVVIPANLQDAMSREAQAERERRARIILGTAETEIAQRFAEASKVYENNPIALQLQAMNILYEGLKERGGLIVTPSGVADSLNIGSLALSHQMVSEKMQCNSTNDSQAKT
jgi:regulator of protease activity HflC (stomatin/prohibitin superfamily)